MCPIRVVVAYGDDAVQKLVVYPNPIQNQEVNVRLDEANTIQLFNSNGQLVYKQTLPAGLNTLHLPDLPKGNYRMRAGERTANLLIQ